MEDLNEINENSASVLSELAEIGEDISASESIIENRRSQISSYQEKIQELLERLQSQG